MADRWIKIGKERARECHCHMKTPSLTTDTETEREKVKGVQEDRKKRCLFYIQISKYNYTILILMTSEQQILTLSYNASRLAVYS